MALPTGVTTCMVTIGTPVTFTGQNVATDATVTPTYTVIHAATGNPIVAVSETLTALAGNQISFTLPHSNQTGFVDPGGNPVVSWAYTITGTWTFAGQTIRFTKNFSLLVGQSVVDLDLVPNGGLIAPVVGTIAPVTSVNGMTGPVMVSAIPAWNAATAYTLGQQVISPNNDVVSALIAHTSGASYTPANWALSTTYAHAASVVAPLASGDVTQGLYQRTQPKPSGSSTFGIVPLAKDPNVAGRIWVQGRDFSQLGFTDTHGDTWTSKAVPPAGAGAGVAGLIFANSYAWLLQGPSAAKQGSLWRSPYPDANGDGLVWTKVFDLAAPPGAITTGDQATFRNSSVAVSGANVYLVEYSVATITGGPSCYYSADSGATWAKVKTWANGKHAHAVKVIGGVPWVTIGDGGSAFTDIGLWNATSAGATVWNQRSQYGEAAGGNTFYGINMIAMNVGGQPMVVSEYDGARNLGPLAFPSQSNAVTKALLPLCTLPAAYLGTMRQLTLTAEGNLIWLHTGEGGAVGPLDSVVIAKGPHFTQPVILEAISSTGSPFGTLGDPVEDGQYVWFGSFRCVKEKFIGQ